MRELLRPRRAEHRLRQAEEFLEEPVSLCSQVGGGAVRVVLARKHAPVGRFDPDLGLVPWPAIRHEHDIDPFLKFDEVGAGHRLDRVRIGRRCVAPGHGECRVETQAELALQAGSWPDDVAHSLGRLLGPDLYAVDLSPLDAVLVRERTRCLDCTVSAVAGRVVLEQVVQDVEAARGRRKRGVEVEVRALRRGETLRALQDVGTAAEATTGELRSDESVLARLACVKRLAHGSELSLEAGGLGCGNADGPRGGLLVEPHQRGASDRSPDGADRTGRVKAACVVAGGDEQADHRRGLVAGDEAAQQLGPGGALRLRGRDDGREDRRSRVPAHGRADVVVVDRVTVGTVQQGGLAGTEALAVSDDAGDGIAPVFQRLVEQHAREWLLVARHRAGEPVEDALRGDFAHVCRDLRLHQAGRARDDHRRGRRSAGVRRGHFRNSCGGRHGILFWFVR